MTSAEEKVNAPGIALMVVGVLTILTALGLSGFSLFGLGMGLLNASDPVSFLMSSLTGVAQLVMYLGGIVAGIVIVMAGSRLRGLQSSGMVYAGAVMALLPCCSSCCCLGLPIGIWVIVTMQDDEVKAAFEG